MNGDGTYTGIYMDSMGNMGPFTAQVDEDGNLVTEWADPAQGTSHRAIETVNPDGTISSQFLMQQPDGSWAESGQTTFTRVAE